MIEAAVQTSYSPPADAPSELAGVARQLADWFDGAFPSEGAHRNGIEVLRRYASELPGSIASLRKLSRVLELAPAEIDMLLLAGLADEHEVIAALYRMVHPRGEPLPTLGLAAQIFCQSFEERRLLRELSEGGPAARAGVLRSRGEGPAFERSLGIAEALWSPIRGGDAWPRGLALVEIPVVLAGSEEFLQQPAARMALRMLAGGAACTILVVAEQPSAALQRAAALAHASQLPFVRVDWAASRAVADAEQLIGLHALARGAVPIVQMGGDDGAAAQELPRFDAYPAPMIVAMASGATAPRPNRPLLTVQAKTMTPEAARKTWSAVLPSLAKIASTLSARYPLEPGAVFQVALDVQHRSSLAGRPANLDDVADSVRTRTATSLPHGISLTRPTAAWDALVLPAHAKQQVREATDRLLHHHRVLHEWGFLAGRSGARGVRVLLAGPPGTGKTLSAEVIAHTLGFDLLVVDLSRTVSKWIGETEKNLASVFDVAERTPAVLLFDEADALFGKRTEGSDAHDRHANLQTAYLLSRIERFEGLVALSTNFRKNIDPAFSRRMDFVIDFEEPVAADRLRLWQCHLPSVAPLAPDVDLDELAQLYPLVGGHVRNAAVGAAFLAAAEGSPLARRHFFCAIQREYEKSGRNFPGAPPHDKSPRKGNSP